MMPACETDAASARPNAIAIRFIAVFALILKGTCSHSPYYKHVGCQVRQPLWIPAVTPNARHLEKRRGNLPDANARRSVNPLTFVSRPSAPRSWRVDAAERGIDDQDELAAHAIRIGKPERVVSPKIIDVTIAGARGDQTPSCLLERFTACCCERQVIEM